MGSLGLRVRRCWGDSFFFLTLFKIEMRVATG